MGSDGIIFGRDSIGITGEDHENSLLLGNSKMGHRDDQENSCRIKRNDHTGIAGVDSKDVLGHYEIYIVSKDLKGELGVALIDTGSQVSLVKESSLVKFRKRMKTFE
jgi:hypothetical protein